MKVKLQVVFLMFLMLTTMFSCKNCCKEDMEFIKNQNKEILKKLKNVRTNLGDFKLNYKIPDTTMAKIDLSQDEDFEPFDFMTSIRTNKNSDSTKIIDYTISFIASNKKIKSIVLKKYIIKEKKRVKNIMRYVVKYEDSPNSQLVAFKLNASNFENNEEAEQAFKSFISGENGEEILRIRLNPKKITKEGNASTEGDVGIMGNERTGIATTTNEVPDDPDKWN